MRRLELRSTQVDLGTAVPGDTSTVAISTGSGIELWSRDGAFIGASDSSIDTGSVVWRSTGIIFIDQSNDLLRLLDPAALQP